MPPLPQYSKIKISKEPEGTIITIPQEKRGCLSYFFGAFIVFWLTLWITALVNIASEMFEAEGIEPFFLVWLIGWFFGGAFAVYMLYRIFRPSIPEQLHINPVEMKFDPGVAPFNIFFGFGWKYQKEYWKSMFPSRKKRTFTLGDMQTLKLRETESANRLTIDQGKDRIDLGKSLTEVEREWLFQALSESLL